MTKFNIIVILIISLIAFAPEVDAGCACSAGNWDPSGFLNSEVGTGQRRGELRGKFREQREQHGQHAKVL
jgi:hypothetical protein